jgi:hypothetical protein
MKKLSDKEIEKAEDFLNRYPVLHDSLTEFRDKISDLEKNSVLILKELEDLRSEEVQYFIDLENKYGKGEIDIKTMSYKKNE